jgi:membrane protease YdiL (CAAX protease family)
MMKALFGKATNQKRRYSMPPLAEILSIVICVLIAEWVVPPLFGKNFLVGLIPACAAFIIMFLSHRVRRESLSELGFKLDNFWRSLGLLAAPMLLATVALIFIGWLSGSLRVGDMRFGWSLLWTYLGLFVWALIQQYPLQGFINCRAQMIWGKGAVSILFTASIFALLHLPNFWLTAATFGGGLLWATVYQRAPNLFALALSHSLMTVVLVTTVPYSSLHGLRVGYNYYW